MPDPTTTSRRGFFRLLGGAAVASAVPLPPALAPADVIRVIPMMGLRDGAPLYYHGARFVRRSMREGSFASQILNYEPIA